MTLRSYTRLRPVSAKRQAQQPARDECCRITLKRARYRCEAKIPGICTTEAFDTHEYCTRAQGGDPTDPDNTFALCRACHRFLHAHPIEAFKMGLIHSAKLEAERG